MRFIILAENDCRLKRHESKEEAMAEAERLCRKEGKRMALYEYRGEMCLQDSPVNFIEATPIHD